MTSNIIEVPISTEVLTEAHRKSTEMGTINNSITKGQGNLSGFIGEGIVAEFLKDVDWTNTYEYDMIFKGLKVDVKTKRTGYPPKPEYDCSVSAGKRQACDVYVFTRVKNDLSMAWLLGFMPAAEYFELANFMEKGTIDPSNGWKVSKDCWNLPISDLRTMDELLNATGSIKSTGT